MDQAAREALNRPSGVIDITTTGRRSGQPRRIEIMFHNLDGRVYISGFPSGRRRNWLANLRREPRFTFHLKQDVTADLPARARVIDDEDERRRVLPGVARNWGRDDIEEMVRLSPLVEVSFEE